MVDLFVKILFFWGIRNIIIEFGAKFEKLKDVVEESEKLSSKRVLNFLLDVEIDLVQIPSLMKFSMCDKHLLWIFGPWSFCNDHLSWHLVVAWHGWSIRVIIVIQNCVTG